MDTRHAEEWLVAPHRGRYARLERQQESKRDAERAALLERIRLLEEEVAWLQRERETA
jgi:hypothetical protein